MLPTTLLTRAMRSRGVTLSHPVRLYGLCSPLCLIQPDQSDNVAGAPRTRGTTVLRKQAEHTVRRSISWECVWVWMEAPKALCFNGRRQESSPSTIKHHNGMKRRQTDESLNILRCICIPWQMYAHYPLDYLQHYPVGEEPALLRRG